MTCITYFVGNTKALSQEYQAWTMVQTLLELRPLIASGKLNLLSGLIESGYLIEMKSDPVRDHSYLSYLRHNSPSSLLALRGVAWLKSDPTKSPEKLLIESKQKPGRKVSNFGSRKNRASKQQSKQIVGFLCRKNDSKCLLYPENIDFHFDILRDIASVAAEKIERDLHGIVGANVKDRVSCMCLPS